MYWVWLIIAIVTEVAGTSSMKLSEGWTKLLPSIAVVVFFSISLFSITLALKGIPISTAYAIWAGLGIVLTSVIGFTIFGENITPLKLAGLAITVAGVVLLRLASEAVA